MAQPTPYVRASLNGATYFTDWTTAHPSTPQQGNKLDQEYNAIALTLAQVLVNLALIQRDDGAIANASVGRDQLKDEVVQGVNTPAAWLTATAYGVRDSVVQTAAWYWATTAHTSTVFATDLAAGKWTLIFDFTSVFSTLLLSNATPVTLGGAATAGVALQASRADHVHTIPIVDELYLRNGQEYFE